MSTPAGAGDVVGWGWGWAVVSVEKRLHGVQKNGIAGIKKIQTNPNKKRYWKTYERNKP